MGKVVDLHPPLQEPATGKPRLSGSALQRALLDRRLLGLAFGLIVTIGLILHFGAVWRPIDYTTTSPWRESDLGMIARNFWRGDMNILYPQIDWRNDGPGYVESELPALPWLMALSYRLFGYHEEFGRVLAMLVSLATLWAFYRLAHKLLPPFQAKLALLFFCLNPLLIDLATNIQPDPMMLLFVILCTGRMLAWLERGRTADLALTALLGALAILMKMPALYLGLVFAPLCFEKFGLKVFRNPKIYLLALGMLLPPLFWYAHAHRFWLLYGNSLGLSNETHWIGRDLLAKPRLLAHLVWNLGKMELKDNLGFFGVVLAAVGCVKAWWRGPRVIFYWLLASIVFYLVALRTTGDNWAYYYHCLSVPPLCLLMGLACSPFTLLRLRRRLAGETQLQIFLSRLVQACFVLTVGVLGLISLRNTPLIPSHPGDPLLHARYTAAQAFQPLIGRDDLVTMIGATCVDEGGAPVAYDDSPMMFWLDRKGFILCMQEDNLGPVLSTKARGAKFFIMKKDDEHSPVFKRTFKLISASGLYELYQL